MSSNLNPDYEIKILLKPSEVLGPNNKLKDEVLSAFGISSGSKKMNIQFIDTKKRDIYNNGWNLRIRKSEGESDFELTYKRRYPINQGISTAAEDNIGPVLKTAQQDGFDSTTTFDPQIEVGYGKLTLSLSHAEEVSDSKFQGIDLPQAKDSSKLLTSKAPDKFKNWSAKNWGTDLLTDSVIYGPVLAKRFKGTWGEFKFYIEIWPIRKSTTDATLEPIVEASFKTSDIKKALEGRAKLKDVLQSKGWLLAEDSLKTKLIMDRYGESTATLK